jgi:hypothetical protein
MQCPVLGYSGRGYFDMSITLWNENMATITLYQDNNFSGRSLDISYPESNLLNEGFNDLASSCRVASGYWLLYKDINFSGSYSILGPGDYADSTAMGLPNDSLSSLRPLPDSGICLFQDNNFGARMVQLTGAQSDLRVIGFNDVISSVIVVSGNWSLYEDINFQGTVWKLGVGRYESAQVGGFKNDAISSVKPT